MKQRRACPRDNIEVKRANILHHNAEAEIFESAHPEGSSEYERTQVLRNITYITKNSVARKLCVDVGCGTGFVTSLELPLYDIVVATDISKQMVKTTKKRLDHYGSLRLVVCDAEFLPLRDEIADLVSVSSVLHHLPKPWDSQVEMSRVLKQDGFLYLAREPNLRCLRRFPDLLNRIISTLCAKLKGQKSLCRIEIYEPFVTVEGLDYDKVDVGLPTGFNVGQLLVFLQSRSFEVVSAYSYHWLHLFSERKFTQKLVMLVNSVIEKIPFSNRFGIFLSLIARKKT